MDGGGCILFVDYLYHIYLYIYLTLKFRMDWGIDNRAPKRSLLVKQLSTIMVNYFDELHVYFLGVGTDGYCSQNKEDIQRPIDVTN